MLLRLDIGYRRMPSFALILATVLAALILSCDFAVADDWAECRSKDTAQRIAACTRILARAGLTQKERLSAHSLRGAGRVLSGSYRAAVEDYTIAMHLEPNANSSKQTLRYLHRGTAYRLLGTYDAAIADLDIAIARDPRSAFAFMERGSAFLFTGKYLEALRDLGESIRLHPTQARTFALRGHAHKYLKHADEALADFTEALSLSPDDINEDNAAVLVARANIWVHKKEYDRAIKDCDDAMQIRPTYNEALGTRGFALALKRDADHAIADLNKVIEIDERNSTYRAGRAIALSQRGSLADLEQAKADLKIYSEVTSTGSGKERASDLASFIEEQIAEIQSGRRLGDRRLALVVGNSRYIHAGFLRNPMNDAKAIAAALKRLGFQEVFEHHDLALRELVAALKAFGDKAATAEWAVVYFAGHGVQLDGKSYLLPTDAKLSRAAHIADEAVSVDRVLAKVADARRLRLVILDACRDNPLLARMEQTGAFRSVGRGLARIETAGGVLVSYSTRDGQTADDGSGDHSPFTQALLEHLERPGLEIGLMFRRVRDTVVQRTDGSQEPFTYGSIPSEELFFRASATK